MPKIKRIVRKLKQRFPKEHFTERHTTPFEILIATVLSQRTRDENTIIAADKLFKKFNTAKKLANADFKTIKRLIKNVGFYNQKAKRIIKISKILLKNYKGSVPKNLNELLSLPGVGRKTANCVLVYGYRIPAIPVDTHVHRISNRIGLIKTKTPEETETALMKVVPKKYWIDLNELFVRHGQTICLPIKPKCNICPIVKECRYKYKNFK